MDVRERWVDEKKISEMTERSVFTLRNDRVQKKGFPFYRIGRSIRYKLSDVFRYLEARKVETEN